MENILYTETPIGREGKQISEVRVYATKWKQTEIKYEKETFWKLMTSLGNKGMKALGRNHVEAVKILDYSLPFHLLLVRCPQSLSAPSDWKIEYKKYINTVGSH